MDVTARRATVAAVCLLVVAFATPIQASPPLLWEANHETGDISEWQYRQGGGIYNSHTPPGTSDIRVHKAVARSGAQSLRLKITEARDGLKQGARMFRTWLKNDVEVEGLPDDGWYSAWYYFPRNYEPEVWWNIFQFKSKRDGGESLSMLSFNIGNLPDGSMEVYVYHSTQQRSLDPSVTVPIKVGQWVHIEAFLRQSTKQPGAINEDGRLEVWIDGVQTIVADGIPTEAEPESRIAWSVNNYTDDITPSTSVIYVDDAAISTTRVGAPACTITGTHGNDVLIGTPGPDVICGLSGDDEINGNGGGDLIIGGAGNDVIRGGPGADVLYGGNGRDVLYGGAGADELHGAYGSDELYGGWNNDVLIGERAADTLRGGKGDDWLIGGPGSDDVNGGPGDDRRGL